MVPVSYTHLDVYKRQKQTRYIKAINYCISQYDFDTVCNVLNSIEATEKLRIEADVYKRQIVKRAVHNELERTQGMGNSFEEVTLSVGEVVHRIGFPCGACAVVLSLIHI